MSGTQLPLLVLQQASASRSILRRWKVPAGRAAAFALGIYVLSMTPAHAQDCPTALSGKAGFVVERGAQQKSEIYHVEDNIVRTVMRYGGTTLLETTQYQGLFQLDRLENGRRTKYEPQTNLRALFPLKPRRAVTAAFTLESNGRRSTLTVEMAVKGREVLYIGPCKYGVLKIDRSESYNGGPLRFVDTDYYSPELRLILAKEYRESGGGTHTVKYDRIYSLRSPAGAGTGRPLPPPPATAPPPSAAPPGGGAPSGRDV